MKREMNQYRQLVKFARAEAYACDLYADRKKHGSKKEIIKLVRKKFKSNKYILEAVEAGAESWNYHNETGPWYDDLKKKIGFFRHNDLVDARKMVKYGYDYGF